MMIDQENKALYIAEQCRKAGMTLAGVAGVLANVAEESAFIPINVQDTFNRLFGISDEEFVRRVDNGDTILFMTPDLGFGLVQWTAQDRKERFLSYMRKLGVSIGDFRTQVDYMILDMRTFYDKRPWNECTTSNDPYQCGYKMCKYYEICANLEASSEYRGNKAKDWYIWLKNHIGEESNISVEPQSASSQPIQSVINPIPAIQIGKIELRTIDQGIDGWPEVWLLQAALKIRGSNVVSNGTFGSSLTEKVKQFQKLVFPNDPSQWDGVVGPLTWAALLAFL